MQNEVIPFVGDNPWALIASGIYFALLLAIGLYSARISSKDQAGFLLGGRKLKAIVVGLSAVVSGRSAWLLLSVSGLAFVYGIATIWFAVGYTIAEFIMFLTMARKLRRETENQGDITLPDYLSSRFRGKSSLIRLLSASIIIIFMVTYVGAQIKAGGKALEAGFHLAEWQGVLITGIVILVYTAVGGFLAVSLTDVLQAFMMLLSLVGLPIVAFLAAGGWGPVTEALDANMLDFTFLPLGVFLGAVGIGLGSTGSPHILVRFMSIEDEKKLVAAGFLGLFWNLVMACGAVAIGVIGKATVPLQNLPGADREMIFPVVATVLPPFFFGLVIASVFAAIMSTADSQLLVATSAVARDIYEKTIRKGKSVNERIMVMLNRTMVVILSLIGIGIALFASSYVNFLVLLAWTGLGCTFGPIVILSLYWQKTTSAGAITGLLAGTVITFIWGLTPRLKAIIHEVVVVFFVTLLVTIVVSCLSQQKNSSLNP
jgi:sodium/proline symporter